MRWSRRRELRRSGVSRDALAALTVRDVPRLRAPVAICSYEGWNDAASAASTATDFLHGSWSATTFAELDPEEFVDFTETRPELRILDGERREIVWPQTVFSWATPPGADFDVVLVRGHEPHLRWRTYTALVVDLLNRVGVRNVVTVGALLSEVAHTRPVLVVGSASNAGVLPRAGLALSRYEGPTGIVGVAQSALADAGIESTSLWASIPYYVPQITSTKAALALVVAAERVLGLKVDTAELEQHSAAYEREVDDLVAEDEDVAAYVARLEEMGETPDEDAVFPDIASEAERYLRDHRRH